MDRNGQVLENDRERAMAFVTLEIGPPWKMQLLLGVLQESGVPAFVADANMKVLDPFVTGPLSFDARLQVPEEAFERARVALQEVRTEGSAESLAPEDTFEPTESEGADAVDPELLAMADLGRRIRFAALCPWLHPILFANGFTYLRGIARSGRTPASHGMTLLTLGVVSAIWLIGLGLVVSGIQP